MLIDHESKSIDLNELTSCANKADNVQMARQREIIRYTPLVGDISASGWKVTLTPIQVCALGDIDNDTRKTFSKSWSERDSLASFARSSRESLFLPRTVLSLEDAT